MVYVDVIDVSWLDVVIGIKTALRSYTDCQKIHQECKDSFIVGWLFSFNGPLRQYFSIYRAVSQREGEREEKR